MFRRLKMLTEMLAAVGQGPETAGDGKRRVVRRRRPATALDGDMSYWWEKPLY
ncbi:MAG: hypothetical protein QXV27_06815 [Candidatus Caldarchaeum sp.]